MDDERFEISAVMHRYFFWMSVISELVWLRLMIERLGQNNNPVLIGQYNAVLENALDEFLDFYVENQAELEVSQASSLIEALLAEWLRYTELCRLDVSRVRINESYWAVWVLMHHVHARNKRLLEISGSPVLRWELPDVTSLIDELMLLQFLLREPADFLAEPNYR